MSVNIHSLAKGLVGHWALDGTTGAKDLTPYSNSGTGAGGITIGGATDQHGQVNRATTFADTSQYISLPAVATVAGLTQVTVAGWFRLTSSPATDTSVVVWAENTSAEGNTRFGFFVRNISGSVFLRMAIRDSAADPAGTAIAINGSTLLSLNTWYHAAVVFNSVDDLHKVYLNGVEDATDSTALLALGTSTSAGINIGRLIGTANNLVGQIADVCLYNRALSATEVTRLYNSYF